MQRIVDAAASLMCPSTPRRRRRVAATPVAATPLPNFEIGVPAPPKRRFKCVQPQGCNWHACQRLPPRKLLPASAQAAARRAARRCLCLLC